MTFHQPDIPTLEKQTFLETFKYKLIYVYVHRVHAYCVARCAGGGEEECGKE